MNRSTSRPARKGAFHFATIAAAVALAAAAGSASAQSGVTISGIADAGFQTGKNFNGASFSRLANGFKSSRLRFTGNEDLGNGLRAFFTLEQGLNVDSGTVSNFGAFHRASFIGLSSPNWGTLRLGKALVGSSRPICVAADLHDCGGGFNNTGIFYNGTNAFGRWVSPKPGRGGNANAGMSAYSGGGAGLPNSSDSGRIANAFFYETPSFNGLQGTVAYGLGETQSGAANGDGDHFGAGLWYRKGDIMVGLNYEKTERDPLWNAEGALWTLGGQYKFGAARIGAVYQRETADGPAALWTKASAWALTGAYRFGAFEPFVKIGSHKTNGVGAYGITNAKDAQMFILGSTYDLSKRTTLYVEFATDYRGSNAPIANAVDPRQFQVGISHTF